MQKRRLFFRFIPLLLSAVLCVSIVRSDTVNDHSQADQKLFQSTEADWNARRWERAAAKYREFIEKFPSHPLSVQAHLRLGTYLSYVTDPEKAMAEYRHVIEMAPRTREAQEAKIGMAALYHALGEYAKARGLFREVLNEAKDWDLVKYSTYRMKEIDRQMRGMERQGQQTTQCGVGALAEVFKIKGEKISLQETAQLVSLDGGMASLAALKEGAGAKGLKALGVKLSLDQLKTIETPVIAHFRPNHYVVVTDFDEGKIKVFDPDHGDSVFPEQGFQKQWTGHALIFPQQEQDLNPSVLLSEEEMQQVKGGHHLHGNTLGMNNQSAFDSGPSCASGGNGVGLPNILVNLANFNLLVQDTDFSYSGRGPRVFVQRTYNADDSDPEGGAFGRSWTFNYELELMEEPGGDVKIKREDGKEDLFISNGDGTYDPPLWSYDRLVKNPDGTFDLYVKRTRLTQHFDAQGRLTWIADRNSNKVTLQYDANGRLQSVTDAVGRKTTFVYDEPNGKIKKVIDPAGREATYTYDGNKNLRSTTDMAGNVISYTYDVNSYMASITTPKGTYQITNVFYDNTFGRVVSSITDPLGNTKSYSTPVSAQGNVVGFCNATSTPSGDIVAVCDANRNPWQYFIRSPDGATTKITDPLGNITAFEVDSNGNKTGITDAKGNKTNLAYDSRGNITSITDPLGKKVTLTYDSNDNLTSLIDPLGNTYLYEYDSRDNLTKVTDPAGGTTTFTYDSFGQLTSLTDARGNSTSFTYDGQGNLKTVTTALGHTTSFSYDSVGRLISVTTPKGDTITYSYDGIDRITEIAYPDGNVIRYTYECCNLTRVSDRNGTLFFDYDKVNRMIGFIDVYGKTLQYDYDGVGNLTSLTYPDGKVVTYKYDAANRLREVTDWLLNTVAYNYDAAGNLITSSASTGPVTAYQYDKANRLTTLANVKPDGSLVSYYKYTLDALGNRTNVDVNEPLSPALQAVTIAYSYDADNRLTSADGTTFAHDDNGNLISETKGANVKSYSYNFDDRLIQATVSGQTTQYQYDGLANRVARTVGSAVTRYVVDPNGVLPQVLAETNSSGNITSYYVYGLGLVSKVTPGGQVYFYQYDGLGSTTAMADLSGNVVNKYAYDPFGNLSSGITETVPNLFRYVGQFGVTDEGNGLLYMRARYYAPNVGRFTNKDPIGLLGGLNMYGYVANNPLNWIDPLGVGPLEDFRNILRGITVVGGVGFAIAGTPVLEVTAGVIGILIIIEGAYGVAHGYSQMVLGIFRNCEDQYREGKVEVASSIFSPPIDRLMKHIFRKIVK